MDQHLTSLICAAQSCDHSGFRGGQWSWVCGSLCVWHGCLYSCRLQVSGMCRCFLMTRSDDSDEAKVQRTCLGPCEPNYPPPPSVEKLRTCECVWVFARSVFGWVVTLKKNKSNFLKSSLTWTMRTEFFFPSFSPLSSYLLYEDAQTSSSLLHMQMS